MFIKYKFTIIYIVSVLIIPVLIFSLTHGISSDSFIILAIIDLCLLFILRNKIELKSYKKAITLFLITTVSILSPVIVFMIMFFSPGQKEHDRIMYDICLPALRKHYGIKEGEGFPMSPVDKDNNAKWWYQHLECEENVTDGKGPTFSDNPPRFIPVIK